MSVKALGYLRVETEHTDAWVTLATSVLGMACGSNSAGVTAGLRMDDRLQRLVLERGPKDGVAAIGWEVADEKTWTVVAERIEKAGVGVTELDPEAAAAVGARGVVRCLSPAGLPLEIFYGGHVEPVEKFVSPLGVAFRTGELGMGHITVFVEEFDEELVFYHDVLGMHLRELIEVDLDVAFLGCNPRQHAVGIARSPSGSFFDHVMIEVEELDDVGRAYDRCRSGAAPVSMTLGRHWNDRMFSFYLITPSGFRIEYGWGGRLIDAADWSQVTQRGVGGGSVWGHHIVTGAGVAL
jgi:2,3-dihydroxybiphenyl 1,2-dioxygenase